MSESAANRSEVIEFPINKTVKEQKERSPAKRLKVIRRGVGITIENVAHWNENKGHKDTAGNYYDPETLEQLKSEED